MGRAWELIKPGEGSAANLPEARDFTQRSGFEESLGVGRDGIQWTIKREELQSLSFNLTVLSQGLLQLYCHAFVQLEPGPTAAKVNGDVPSGCGRGISAACLFFQAGFQ